MLLCLISFYDFGLIVAFLVSYHKRNGYQDKMGQSFVHAHNCSFAFWFDLANVFFALSREILMLVGTVPLLQEHSKRHF